MLTRRHLQILRELQALPDGEREIVCDGERCVVGMTFIRRSTVDGLLAHMAVKDSGYSDGERCQIFIPNENTGHIIERPALADEMVARVMARKPFFVTTDGVIKDA